MKNLIISFLDLIYKKKCYFCGKSKYSVKMCPECYDELSFADIKVNRILCGINIYSCGIYEKNLQKLIRGLKYHGQKELAFYLAKFMYEYFIQLGINSDFQVVPVPLHQKRIKKRKYNHMNLAATEFCKLSGLTLNLELIKRIKDTKPQYKLSKAARADNLRNAFAVDKTKDYGKPILIIDDICTTGSTFEEMIKTLRANDFNNIVCLSASAP